MKIKLLAIALITTICFSSKAQDLIIFKNYDVVKARVIEVTPVEIKYKKTDNPDGPTYTVLKSTVASIKYENGTKDEFANGSNTKTDSSKTFKEKPLINSHKGFQFSFYAGGASGDVVAKGPGVQKIVFQGSTTQIRFHFGYANGNLAFGAALGTNTMTISHLIIRDTTYTPVNVSPTIDNGFFGIYIKKYFMPVNIFICGELGTGHFSYYSNSNATNPPKTQSGFAWSIRAGKEFLLGRKKRFGLGAYVNLSGLKCNDNAPFSSDVYRYIGPGIGLAFSYH